MNVPAYVTTTHNGKTFGVSSEPMPSRVIRTREQNGRARLIYKATSPYETDFQNFEAAIAGWSRIDPSFADRLNRYYPLGWPLHEQGTMNVLAMNLMAQGRIADPDNATAVGGINPTTVNNPSTDSWWPSSPGYLYDCDFGPLPYSRFMTDSEAYTGVTPPKELGRFIKLYEQAVPREFRRPDYGFVTDTVPSTEVLQIGFVPFVQSEVEYTWFQVPYPDAVPWNTIEALYLHVNGTDFDGDLLAVGYPAGELLFTRASALDDWYYGPGGEKYVDIKYNFTRNFFGWNNYLKPDGTVVQLKRKNVTPATPPYIPAPYAPTGFLYKFEDLFDPSAG